ncbi:MAG: hypothetical protein KDI90_09155 [Alphaproteobacteria bacterium]|nr:hypothetical protein [Alphaproteobacteria bacterium]
MAYALAALFDDAIEDKGKFTIFRPDNTLEPVDLGLIKKMHEASGLDVPDLVRMKPERLVTQWVAALVPFSFQLDNDEKFLEVSGKVRDYCLENMSVIDAELTSYYDRLLKDVKKAVAQEFDRVTSPEVPIEVYDTVHQIRRLIALREDLGLCAFDETEKRRLTEELALSFFYNREAESLAERHVSSAVESLLLLGKESGLTFLPDQRALAHKHIHVSGGQGAGKTQLSRRTLGLLNESIHSYIRINKDISRPLILDPDTMNGEGDLSDPANRKSYGRLTEDELNMVKRKQWATITELAETRDLPDLFVDSTSIIHPHHVSALTDRGATLSVLYVHTPVEEARRRILERALGDGIPGVDTMRESLESELIQGHRESARQIASLLIHGVGNNIKVKILDGRSADRTKPVHARIELDKGRMEVRNVRSILEIFYKSTEGKTATEPNEDDLKAQIQNFDKIASVMGEISFFDPASDELVALYDNRTGLTVLNQELFEDEFEGTLTGDVMARLDQFFKTHKAALLRDIATRKGHIFEDRDVFAEEEPFQIITDNFETEVPVVQQSAYVADSEEERLLEWRHIAKRGKFLDGSFDPWRKTAPDEMRALSARAVTNTWLSDAVISQIVDNVAEKLGAQSEEGEPPLTVHISHPIKDHTRPGVNINYMVLAYTQELTRRLNAEMEARHAGLKIKFTNDRPLLALASDRSTRTTAGTLERLTSQPFYDSSVFESGDHVLFADEHVQAGGVMLAARNVRNTAHINILGYTALSSHNLGSELKINPTLRVALDSALEELARVNKADPQVYESDLDDALKQVGLSRDTLTNLEGLILIAYFLDGKEESKRTWFEDVKKVAGYEVKNMREGMDSLSDILGDDPVSPAELKVMMAEQIDLSRKAVYPSITAG